MIRSVLANPPQGSHNGAEHVENQTSQPCEVLCEFWISTDAQGIIVNASVDSSAILSCTHSFLIGTPLVLLFSRSTRSRFFAAIMQVSRGVVPNMIELQIERRSSIPRDVVMSVAVEEEYLGKPSLIRWTFRDVTERKQSEQECRILMERLATVVDDERRRVAREIHDSFGQMLGALNLAIHAARTSMTRNPATALQQLNEVQRVADELGKNAHELATRLRPSDVEELGLEAALGQYLHEWSKRCEIAVHYDAAAIQQQQLHADAETTLYRIVIEALTNIHRHAHASQVNVTITIFDGIATLVVEDDGIGFDADRTACGRLGILGMRERAALVGGTIEIESTPGSGATLIVRVPLLGGNGHV